MVLFFTIALGLSIGGMASLLALKRYELDTGKLVMADVRPVVGEFFHRVVVMVGSRLPDFAQRSAARATQALRALAHHMVARATLGLEQMLERVLHTVREKTSPPRAPGEASAFLREVADHKKQILKRRPRRTPSLKNLQK